MGILAWLRGGRYGHDELFRRLGLPREDVHGTEIAYTAFTIPKRSGGLRTIHAPGSRLKGLQRRVYYRLLYRLGAHPAAHGFEVGRSIVTHARLHVGQAVVVRFDIEDFFPSTEAQRVNRYFRRLGWDRRTARLLCTWLTHEGGLPQGAPTSPRLANLLNYRLDARLEGLARRYAAVYSRYADDLTFSWRREPDAEDLEALINLTARVAQAEGYRLHRKKKLHIMRAHNRQHVTGLVVNDHVSLPRETRRWLRAVEHRMRTGGRPTLTEAQLDGWRALARMVEIQGRRRL